MVKILIWKIPRHDGLYPCPAIDVLIDEKDSAVSKTSFVVVTMLVPAPAVIGELTGRVGGSLTDGTADHCFGMLVCVKNIIVTAVVIALLFTMKSSLERG